MPEATIRRIYRLSLKDSLTAITYVAAALATAAVFRSERAHDPFVFLASAVITTTLSGIAIGLLFKRPITGAVLGFALGVFGTAAYVAAILIR